MNMTSVFVELIVIGVGATTILILVALSFLGWRWVPWASLSSLPMAVPALSIIYVLGIAMDRIADRLFEKSDHKLRSKFFKSGEEYHAAKNKVYTIPSRQELQEYGKSRLRISRAWSLIWAALAVLIPFFMWSRCAEMGDVRRTCLVSAVLCLLLSMASYYAWRSISLNNYRQIAKH